jgi:hypothetical protein
MPGETASCRERHKKIGIVAKYESVTITGNYELRLPWQDFFWANFKTISFSISEWDFRVWAPAIHEEFLLRNEGMMSSPVQRYFL